MTTAAEVVRATIERRGPISFDELVEIALYHPTAGFYAGRGGGAGRRRDFLTSAEVGPLFGAVVARAIDAWWTDLGAPDVATVVEVGAGPGTLARSVLAAGPACAPALRYVLVERSAAQRASHRTHLPLEVPAAAFASTPDDEDAAEAVAPPPGPIVVSLAELPRLPGPCFVVANELLDNLPFGLVEHRAGGWHEVRVGVDGDDLAEVLVPTDAERRPADDGARLPVQRAAERWVRDAVALAGPGGRVTALDYCSTDADLLRRPWTDWVRTYRDHARGRSPLVDLGAQDITCEVSVDQLPAPARTATQADWLRAHGIEALVAEGKAIWQERAALGDLEAIRARSRVGEGEALLDPAGLGGFTVLEWDGL